MKDRTKSILLTAVGDFIRWGEPITSQRLFEFYDFGIKPAMIRWELNELSRNGYFYQLHPSGGRYPTNKAYRFFLNNLYNLYNSEIEVSDGDFFEFLKEELLEGKIEDFINTISTKLGILSVGYKVKERLLYLSGLYDLLKRLEVSRSEEFLEIIKDFEEFPQKITSALWRKYLEKSKKRPQIFIGKNKLVRSDVVSVFADCINFKDDKFIIFVVGPKRVDYEKLLKLFRVISNLEKNYE